MSIHSKYGGCSTGAVLSVTKNFSRVGSNVYIVHKGELYFPSLLAKNQTCLIVPDHVSAHLENSLSQSLPVLSYHFQFCPIMNPACLLSLK